MVNISKVQNGDGQVDVTGSAVISDLMSGEAAVRVEVTATDNCGAVNSASDIVNAEDTTPPMINVTISPNDLWPADHMIETITANVTTSNNCPGVAFHLDSVTGDEPDNGQDIGDGNTIDDIQNADFGTSDVTFDFRRERDQEQDGRTYTIINTATDGGGNTTQESSTVFVAHDQDNRTVIPPLLAN
ncbi:MAG: hypothetical protein ACU843_12585 [Gammaproteobacteria bacterium]